MRKTTLFMLAWFLSLLPGIAQNLPQNRRSDWQNAGRPSPIPQYTQVLNIQDFGGKGDNSTLNEIPFQQAVAALQGQPGVIFFPEGQYLFHQPMYLRDSLIVRGAGAPQTALIFDLGSNYQNCILGRGTLMSDADALLLTESVSLNDTSLSLNSTLKAGDFIRFQFDDSLVVFSDWARGHAGQLLEIVSASPNQVQVNHPLRFQCDLALRPRLRVIEPVQDAGLECLKIKRLDPNVPIGSNVVFEHARRCWLVGVESETCNFAHFSFDGSAHCEIYGCYAQDAFAFGGGGQGYGLVFQYTASDNRAQNNIFRHLRHSMLLQSGANGNVLGYNFSTDPFWEEFPNDGAGEIVLHGNYPSYNLFEGNICENIRPDGSHGNNGPMNTLFRNRTTGYGLIVTGAQYQHALNILANEIVGGAALQGIYLGGGQDNMEAGNSQNGQIIPAGTLLSTDSSLYLSAIPKFLSGTNYLMGPPANFNTATIPAKERFFSATDKTDCDANTGITIHTTQAISNAAEFDISPNPAGQFFTVSARNAPQIVVLDLTGKVWFNCQNPVQNQQINCQFWPSGLYIVQVKHKEITVSKIIVKSQ